MSTGGRTILTEEGRWWVAEDEGTGESPTGEQPRKADIDPERNVSGELYVAGIFE